MKRFVFLALAALAAGCSHRPPPPAAAAPPVAATPAPQSAGPAAWIQLMPGGSAEVRSIGVCNPVIFDNGNAVPMHVRAAATSDFPEVCSLPIPAGARSVEMVAGKLGEPRGTIVLNLPAPVADPQRILVLGDTGCRIKGTYLQACNDPVAWPFAGLARAAAAMKPDLVVHLGDYLYRESPCPAGNAGCVGSPWGDNWASWDADFFTPAAPLLAAAPWVIIRGNHEDCQRGGPGFLRLLGPVAFDATAPCTEHLDPYVVMAGSQTIAIMDNASASDTSVDAKAVPVYQKDFEALKAVANTGAGRELWLAAHRPIWAAITGPLGVPIGGSATLIEAAGDLSAFNAISLMLAGHIHTFEAINYAAKLPPQIVAGHGGDNLDPTPANLKGTIFQGHSGVSVKDGLSVAGFGFLMMTKSGDGWTIQLYDSDGRPEKQCMFTNRRVFCLAPK